jgi:hypothetical protein
VKITLVESIRPSMRRYNTFSPATIRNAGIELAQ